MKIAINHYGRFEYEPLGLFLNAGDSFVVTPKIEESKQFQIGLQRGKFEFISNPDLALVQRAHGITEKMLKVFTKELTAVPENEKEVDPVEQPQAPPAGEHPAEEIPSEPELPFTEVAGNAKSAKVAIEKETDIEKLKFALVNDSRKEVRKALEVRIKELTP